MNIDGPDATEITEDDFEPLRLLMGILAKAAAIEGVDQVVVQATVNGQQFAVGFGEAAEPAVLLGRETS